MLFCIQNNAYADFEFFVALNTKKAKQKWYIYSNIAHLNAHPDSLKTYREF